MDGTWIWTGAKTLKTPEQDFITLIKELRELGVKYRQLMHKLAAATHPSEVASISEEIDDILSLTMATAQKLPCDKDTDGDGNCHECHTTGGCTNPTQNTEGDTNA